MTPEQLRGELDAIRQRATAEVADAEAAQKRGSEDLAAAEQLVQACTDHRFPGSHVEIAAALVEPSRRVRDSTIAGVTAAVARVVAACDAVAMADEHVALQAAGAAGEFYQKKGPAMPDNTGANAGPERATIASLAAEFGAQPHEVAAFGDLGDHPQDTPLDAATEAVIREAWAAAPDPETGGTTAERPAQPRWEDFPQGELVRPRWGRLMVRTSPVYLTMHNEVGRRGWVLTVDGTEHYILANGNVDDAHNAAMDKLRELGLAPAFMDLSRPDPIWQTPAFNGRSYLVPPDQVTDERIPWGS